MKAFQTYFKSSKTNFDAFCLCSLDQYRQKYIEALGSKSYFHGSAPGIVDVSLCGVLAPFMRAGNDCVLLFLGETGVLSEWHRRMSNRLPNIF